jgi:hypothetical protein
MGGERSFKHGLRDGHALVPAAKLLKDTSALREQEGSGVANVMYVAVRQRLIVSLFSLFVAELVAVHRVHVHEDVAGSVLMAAGQRDLKRRPHRERPVFAHGPDDSSFNTEGIADHVTQAELL